MKAYHGIILSIMVHLLLTLGVTVAQYEFPDKVPERKTWLELKDQETNLPLMSDVTKRVKKQTRTKETTADNVGVFSRPSTTLPTPMSKNQDYEKSSGKHKGETLAEALHSKTFDKGDVFLNPNNSGSVLTQQTRQQLQSFLPRDLELGDVVALNSDQNIFYNYYRRMAEKVMWPWAQHVLNNFEQMRVQGQLGNTRKAWVTVIEVVLDENGSVVSTQPLQLSGTWDMDSAPTKAFKQARHFPNPPQEMIEEDGYIHIRYRFIVYYTPRSDL